MIAQRIANISRALGLILFIATAVIGAVGLWRGFNDWSFQSASKTAVAKTVEVEVIRNLTTQYVFVLEFTDESGVTHRIKSPKKSDAPLEIEVTPYIGVRYLPDNPSVIRHGDFGSMWGVSIFLAVCAVICLIFGGLFRFLLPEVIRRLYLQPDFASASDHQ